MRTRSAVFLAALLTGILATSGVRAQGSPGWPTFQGDKEHDGHVGVTLDPSTFTELWSVSLGTYALQQVAAAKGLVYVTINTRFEDVDQLFALDAASGQVLWTQAFGPVSSVSPPACAYGSVYVLTGHGTSSPPPLLRAFDAATGDFLFQQQFSAQWEHYYAPTPYDGILYADGGTYGGMYAYDAFAPQIDWFAPLNQYDEWTPAVDDGYVYAYTGEYDPRLSIVDRSTGVETRSIPDPNFSWNGWSMNLAPVLGGHQDIVAVQGSRLLSFDLSQDTIRFELGPNYFSGQPSVANGRIYVMQSGALTVRDELTGSYLWGWATSSSVTNPILVTDRHALVSTYDAVYAVDLGTHQEVWSALHAGQLAWSEGVLYVAGTDGVLTAWAAPAVPAFPFRDGFESGDTSAWSTTSP